METYRRLVVAIPVNSIRLGLRQTTESRRKKVDERSGRCREIAAVRIDSIYGDCLGRVLRQQPLQPPGHQIIRDEKVRRQCHSYVLKRKSANRIDAVC